jgi:heat shock protein HslJ
MSMRIALALAVPLAFASSLLAACGDDTVEPVAPADPVEGHTFVGYDVQGRSLVPGSSVRLSFDNGSIGAQAGCNQLIGPYRVDDDVLVVEKLGGTQMACEQALMDQDVWLADFLQGRPSLETDGASLILSSDDVTVTLTEEGALRSANPLPLEGTTWQLESVLSGTGDDSSASSVPGQKPPTIRFEDGRAEVFSGCNRGSGSVEIGEETLTVTGLALTKMACPDELGTLESTVLAVLDGEVGYEQDYDTLTLTGDDGEGALVYRPAS